METIKPSRWIMTGGYGIMAKANLTPVADNGHNGTSNEDPPMIKPASSLLALLLAAGPALSDTVITFQNAGKGAPNRIAIHHGMVQMPAPQGGMRLIMDTNSRNMVMINDAQKQYMQMNSGTIEKTNSLMSAMRQQMMAQLKNMPEEQRKMIEKRMGLTQNPPAAPKMTLKATDKMKRISNVPCKVTEILRNGEKVMEACVAKPADARIASEDYATMKKMFDMSRQFAKQSAKMAGPAASGIASMPDLNGVPMEVRDLKGGHTVTIANIDSKAKLKDADFKPGAKYQKIDPLQQMRQMQQQMKQH